MAKTQIKYHKAIKENGKVRFVEAWGEKLRIKLPCGNVMICACEYGDLNGYRSWRVTDTASGLLMQNQVLKNKKERDEYFSNPDILEKFSKNLNATYYKKAVADLEAYEANFA